MPCGMFVTTDVPPDKVGAVQQGYQMDGATSVTTTAPDAKGNVTVIAAFPPCADGTNPVSTAAHAS